MRSLIVSILIVFVLTPSVLAGPSAEQVMTQFEETVFRHEFRGGGTNLNKWVASPRFGLAGAPGVINRYLSSMDKQIDDINRTSGLSWQVASDPADATFQANFVARVQFPLATGLPDMAAVMSAYGDSVCIGRALYDEHRFVLSRAVVVFDIDSRDELMRHCIAEEMVQVMGIPNDACNYRPSLFCEDDIVDEMQPADRIILRTLYDPRLKPGMTRAEAMPIAREIIRELWRE